MQAPEQNSPAPIAADVIARLQKAYGVTTDSALARAMDLPGSTVGSWRSRGSVPYANCVDAATALRISVDWILFGLGNMNLSAEVAETPGTYIVLPALMRSVIEAAAQLFEEEQLHLPPAKFAELCMLAYELERTSASPNPKARVVQLMRLAA